MQCHRSSVGGGSACGHRRAAAPPAQLPARPCRPQLDVLLAAAQPRNGNGNGLGPSTSQPARGDALRVSSAAGAPGSHRDSGSSSPEALNLAFESDKKNKQASGSGLRRAPLGGGVKTATSRFHLPSPQVAVRNLVEIAQYAHLCTVMSDMHHRRAGYPFGTLVDFATDGAGYPIFCLSPLAIHARNLIEDNKCSLVVQMPGWYGLANARVTIFGDVYQLPAEMQEAAREMFLAKHAPDKGQRWVFGNFLFFRMHRIVDIYFVGGFGTVQWIDPADFTNCKPDAIVLDKPQRTLQLLNEHCSQDLKRVLNSSGRALKDLSFISIDAGGADIRVRNGGEVSVERIGFDAKVTNVDEALAAVRRVIETGHVSS